MYYFPFSELLHLTPVLFVAFIPWALVAITLLDAVRHPASDWELADQDQLLWTIVILSGGFIPVIGPAAYLLVARPRLRAVARRMSITPTTTQSSTVGTDVR